MVLVRAWRSGGHSSVDRSSLLSLVLSFFSPYHHNTHIVLSVRSVWSRQAVATCTSSRLLCPLILDQRMTPDKFKKFTRSVQGSRRTPGMLGVDIYELALFHWHY